MKSGLALLLAAFSALVWAQTPAPVVRLPAEALKAADAGALALAAALATRLVPMSVVTTDDPSAVAPARVDPAAALTTTLDDIVARFRSAHPDYEAAIDNGVLKIQQPDLACLRSVGTLTLRATNVSADMARLLILLSWMASGDPPPIPAGQVSVLGAHEGDPLPQPPPLPDLHLTVSAGTTLAKAFDDVVRLNHGGVWIVWQHDKPDGSIGCRSVGYYSTGAVGAAMKDFAVIRK